MKVVPIRKLLPLAASRTPRRIPRLIYDIHQSDPESSSCNRKCLGPHRCTVRRWGTWLDRGERVSSRDPTITDRFKRAVRIDGSRCSSFSGPKLLDCHRAGILAGINRLPSSVKYQKSALEGHSRLLRGIPSFDVPAGSSQKRTAPDSPRLLPDTGSSLH